MNERFIKPKKAITNKLKTLKQGVEVKVLGKGDLYTGKIGKIYRNFSQKQTMTIEFDDNTIGTFGYDEISLFGRKKEK